MSKYLPRLALSLAMMALLVAASASRAAVTDLYARLDSGYSIGTIESQAYQSEKVGGSAIFGATVGYQLGYGLAVELGLSYRGGYKYQSSVTGINPSSLFPMPIGTTVKSDVSALTIMPQVVYRFDMVPIITPYAAFGLGFSRNTTGDGTVTVPSAVAVSGLDRQLTGMPGTITGGTIKGATNNALAYKIGAGIEYSVLPFLNIQLGYRFLNLGAFKTASLAPLTPNFSADTPAPVRQALQTKAAAVTYSDRKPVAHEIVLGLGYRF